MSKHINTHPGELLLEEFLKPMDITPYRLAKEAKIPPQRVHEIIHGRRSVTADTDLRLARFFGLTPGYWLRAQVAYDLREAIHALGRKVNKEVRPFSVACAT
jgi:antitoxin HigA-1